MKNIILLSICLCMQFCGKVELMPSTSNEIMAKVKELKGEKAVLINVWALWCVPCVEEFPMIMNLGEENEKLEVIFISADFADQMDDVRSFLDQNGVRSISYIKEEKDGFILVGLAVYHSRLYMQRIQETS